MWVIRPAVDTSLSLPWELNLDSDFFIADFEFGTERGGAGFKAGNDVGDFRRRAVDGRAVTVDAARNEADRLDLLVFDVAAQEQGVEFLVAEMVHVMAVVADGVGDHLALVDLDGLEDVGVVTDDEVGACVNPEVGAL